MTENYLTELEELQKRLKWFLRKDLLEELVELQDLINNSFVNKYTDLTAARGNDCAWAARAKDLFMQLQEQAISEKIEHIFKTYIESK